MFGKKKKETPKAEPAPEVPDLVVNTEPVQPQHVGMPGFVPDAPQPVQQPAATPVPVAPAAAPAPQAPPLAPAVAPAPAPAVKEWYQVQAAEQLSDGMYRYVLISSRPIGEVGGIYDI